MAGYDARGRFKCRTIRILGQLNSWNNLGLTQYAYLNYNYYDELIGLNTSVVTVDIFDIFDLGLVSVFDYFLFYFVFILYFQIFF